MDKRLYFAREGDTTVQIVHVGEDGVAKIFLLSPAAALDHGAELIKIATSMLVRGGKLS